MTDIISKIDNRYPPNFDKTIKNIERRRSLTDDDINSTLQNIFKGIDPEQLDIDMNYRYHKIIQKYF